MSASQPAYFHLQEFSDLGIPLVGGRLYTYTQGTTALKTAYTDPAGAIPQTYTADGLGGQYIALNARGELPAPLYLTVGAYDIALKRADGSAVWTRRAEPTADGAPSGASIVGADDAAAGTLFTTVAGFIAKILSSVGSSFIGFIQAGAGAVARKVQDKLRPVIDLEDFGAIGDGITDDTLALSRAAAALRAQKGGRLRLSPGKDYLVLPTGGTYLSSLADMTGCYGVTVEGNGARIVTGSVTMTQYLFDMNGTLGVKFENLRVKSGYQVLNDAAGIYWFRAKSGARSIVFQNVDCEYGNTGFVAQGKIVGEGEDSNRVRGIVFDNFTTTGTYYPASFQGAGDNVRGNLITRNAGRSYFLYNVHDHKVEVDSQQGGPFSDVLIKCYGSTLFASKTANIDITYRSDGRYAGSGNQSADEAMVGMDFQLWTSSPAPVVFSNIKLQFDVSPGPADRNQSIFVARKYDSAGNPDAVARGHTLVGLDIEGTGLSLQNLVAGAVRVFSRAGEAWAGEYVYGLNIHDALLSNLATQNSLELNCDPMQSAWKIERVRAIGDLALTNPTGKDLSIEESVFDNYTTRSRIPQRYVPAWTATGAAPSIGNGTIDASYTVQGKLCTVQIYMVAGSTTSFGTGNWRFSLPFTSSVETINSVGSAFALDSGTAFRTGICMNDSGTSTATVLIGDAVPDFVTNVAPFTWAANDYLRLQITYAIG